MTSTSNWRPHYIPMSHPDERETFPSPPEVLSHSTRLQNHHIHRIEGCDPRAKAGLTSLLLSATLLSCPDKSTHPPLALLGISISCPFCFALYSACLLLSNDHLDEDEDEDVLALKRIEPKEEDTRPDIELSAHLHHWPASSLTWILCLNPYVHLASVVDKHGDLGPFFFFFFFFFFHALLL